MVPNGCMVYKESKKLSHMYLSQWDVRGKKSVCLLVTPYIVFHWRTQATSVVNFGKTASYRIFLKSTKNPHEKLL